MRQRPSQAAGWFLVILFLIPFWAPRVLEAQTFPPPTPQELDQLLAPVALFPDPLLAQITTASTDPQQILDFSTWLANNPTLTGQNLTNAAQAQGFDPAFIALATFPRVVGMMAENIDDFAWIGIAFKADPMSVTASIQRLRNLAYSAGNLATTPQQTVQVQPQGGTQTIIIQPANPQVVYVPVYDPTMVFVPRPVGFMGPPMMTFGTGIGIGWLTITTSPWGWGGWGWGWGPGGGVMFNRTVWTGWGPGGWHSPNPWFRPRPVVWANRPGWNGNWNRRPPNWRPPMQSRPPVVRPGVRPQPPRPAPIPPTRPPGGGSNRPGGGGNFQPGNRPGGGAGAQPGNRPGGGAQPGNRPGGGNQPGGGAQPGNRPGGGQPANRPGGAQPGNRPGGGGQPANRPAGGGGQRPGGGGGQPASRPAGGGGQRPGGGGPPSGGNRPQGGGGSGGNRGGGGQSRPQPQQ